MKISRRALYEAVWSKPVRTLAREWAISDVGLAKACRKHGIPLPPVGYWAKAAVGRAPEKPDLGGIPDFEVAFDGAPSLRKQPLSNGTKQQLEVALRVIVPAVGKNIAPPMAHWTKKTQLALSRKPDANGFVTAYKDAFRVNHPLWRIFARTVENGELATYLSPNDADFDDDQNGSEIGARKPFRASGTMLLAQYPPEDLSALKGKEDEPRIEAFSDYVHLCAMFRLGVNAGYWLGHWQLIYLSEQAAEMNDVFRFIRAPFIQMLEDYYGKPDWFKKSEADAANAP